MTASPVANVDSTGVDDDLTGLDADPSLEPELGNRVDDRERSADRALGVVLVRLRDPERGHDRVAGELLDDAAVGDDTLLDAVEVLLHAAARHLGIGAGDERRRPDEIDEEDRRKLAFHAHKCMNDRRRRKRPDLRVHQREKRSAG